MAEQMTEEELKSRIGDELRSSLGYFSDELSQQRELAMEYYYALPFGNEVEVDHSLLTLLFRIL